MRVNVKITPPTPSSISVVGLLTVTFVVLKLTHVIDWSWWWVLSPVWISLVLSIALIVVVLSTIKIVHAISEYRGRKRVVAYIKRLPKAEAH